MSITELDAYMELTTAKVEGNKIGDKQVVWEVTVMGPNATAKLLGMLPDNEDVDVAKFIKENYLTIARDVVHPSILKPKIPVERLTLADVNIIFPVLYEMSFPRGEDEGDEFRPK